MNKKIFFIAVVTLIIDQVSKGIISAFFAIGEGITLIPNFWSLTYVENTGAAWGILAGRPIVIIFISIVAFLLFYRFLYSFRQNKRNTLAFGLVFGGITGNLIDRVLFGYVKDFFDFSVFGYDFPVFNISDMAIVIGIFLLIIAVFKGEDKREKNCCDTTGE